MEKTELIDVEIALLLVRYGEQAVLKRLAKALEVSEEELNSSLSKARFSKSAAPPKRRSEFSLDRYVNAHPDLAEQLRGLDARYDNRTFLAELRDVKRFLERAGDPAPRLKSRHDAKKRLFDALSRMSPRELDRLRDEVFAFAGGSSLGIISDQILGRKKP